MMLIVDAIYVSVGGGGGGGGGSGAMCYISLPIEIAMPIQINYF